MPETDSLTSRLTAALQPYVESGAVPGLVAGVADPDGEHVVVLGRQAVDGPPMVRNSLFRIASITKPLIAAATVALAEEGRLALDEPVARLLPELAEPRVLRRLDGPVDDTVPAVRPITVRHLLTFTAGHGFPSDFSAPVVQLLVSEAQQGSPDPRSRPDPDTWMQRLATVPLLHQPGEGWTYNTGSDILGVLLARASGRPLPELLADVLFEPLGMTDTGFWVKPEDQDRLTGCYQRAGGAGGLEPVEAAYDGWTVPPAFPSGAGGLVSTLDDWFAFGRMLTGGGVLNGRRVLYAGHVKDITADALTDAQREAGRLFLEGQGWGFGGGVDIDPVEPWQEVGRYGWVGGTGTAAHVIPARGRVAVLLTQVAMTNPAALPIMNSFWEAAAGR